MQNILLILLSKNHQFAGNGFVNVVNLQKLLLQNHQLVVVVVTALMKRNVAVDEVIEQDTVASLLEGVIFVLLKKSQMVNYLQRGLA